MRIAIVLLLAGCGKKDTGPADTEIPSCDLQARVCTAYGSAIPKVASDITDAAARDPEFAADFAPLVARGQPAVDGFKAGLAAFLSDAYGCTTGTYTGPSMPDAHAGLGITEQQYDDFVGLVAGVLADDGVAQADIDECFAPVLKNPTLTATIVGH